MSNPPRIWLNYRPVRIGWVVEGRNVSQLVTATSWSTCLWGGRFNPIIPTDDVELANNLIATFRVDVLIPIAASEATSAFIAKYPHLYMDLSRPGLFADGRCDFADIRHAMSRAMALRDDRHKSLAFEPVRPVWSQDDPLAALLSVLVGRYPDPNEVTIDYAEWMRRSLDTFEFSLTKEIEVPTNVVGSLTPLALTSYGITSRSIRPILRWFGPGLVFGDAQDFNDLVLCWNLRASGAEVWFCDKSQKSRLGPSVDAFVAALRKNVAEVPNRIRLWLRTAPDVPEQWTSGLDLTGFQEVLCIATEATWNDLNVIPVPPQFSYLHRDVVPSYAENADGGVASFALADQPFDYEDSAAFDQRFVVTVDAKQAGPAPEDLTFNTPFVSRLNDFYSMNFQFGVSEARSELGFLGQGAVGIVSRIGDQRLEVRAIRVQEWIRHFFDLFGVMVERSEPGRRCSRLIRQLGGIQGCRVLKVRGARALIKKYSPDQSFTRSGAICCIRDVDQNTQQHRFQEFENLRIRPHQGQQKLTPDQVFGYMTSAGVFRVGLDLKCSNCDLENWIPLDDVKTMSTCIYCGQPFDVMPQLKDRDWRYRRSGLFGRDDDQLGGIPVALALQQLETSLQARLLMYSTALKFKSQTAKIEECEADFVAVVAGRPNIDEASVQILIGEGKTSSEIDANDARKLGMLAHAIPSEVAQAFIMFAKTSTFTPDEVTLARTLNSPEKVRVILWERDQLEPRFVYERCKDRLGGVPCASSLIDMVQATEKLF
jgi:hypothetical protein